MLVVWAFGWTRGKLLVEQSYTDAKLKVGEQKARRAETKATKHAERAAQTHRGRISKEDPSGRAG